MTWTDRLFWGHSCHCFYLQRAQKGVRNKKLLWWMMMISPLKLLLWKLKSKVVDSGIILSGIYTKGTKNMYSCFVKYMYVLLLVYLILMCTNYSGLVVQWLLCSAQARGPGFKLQLSRDILGLSHMLLFVRFCQTLHECNLLVQSNR